jgi:threonine dehydratase
MLLDISPQIATSVFFMSLNLIGLAEIVEARRHLPRETTCTPLIPLRAATVSNHIYLKMENLQPTIGVFKVRAAVNALAVLSQEERARGVYTASSGNMAQGVAWAAEYFGVPATVLVPEGASEAKLARLAHYDAEIRYLPLEEWWRVIDHHGHPDIPGTFIHPVANEAVMAGNGVIGLEIIEQMPQVDAIVVPFGGGGLICGIAAAAKALRPEVRIYAAEFADAAPLASARAAGQPVEVGEGPAFLSGIAVGKVVPEMWPLLEKLVDEILTASLDEIISAVRMLALGNKVVTEGAGATSLAATLSSDIDGEHIVCVLSGGNIRPVDLAAILRDEQPG